MLGVFADESDGKAKPMLKAVKRRRLLYSEESYRERLGAIRGDIALMEHMMIVTAKPLELAEKTRDLYNLLSKTTKGDSIGPILWKPWSAAWKDTVAIHIRSCRRRG